jgi:hypothetical protein
MNDIQKYTQAIRDNQENIEYGTLSTLTQIDRLSVQLESENAALRAELERYKLGIRRLAQDIACSTCAAVSGCELCCGSPDCIDKLEAYALKEKEQEKVDFDELKYAHDQSGKCFPVFGVDYKKEQEAES